MASPIWQRALQAAQVFLMTVALLAPTVAIYIDYRVAVAVAEVRRNIPANWVPRAEVEKAVKNLRDNQKQNTKDLRILVDRLHSVQVDLQRAVREMCSYQRSK